MQQIEIKNPVFQDLLNSIAEKIIFPDKYWKMDDVGFDIEKTYHLATSTEYLKEMQEKGHNGPPHIHYSNSLRRYKFDQAWVKVKLGVHFRVKIMTLLSYYPPLGCVGWHSNFDMSGYNLLLTWSEEGDGFFRYQHPLRKTLVTIPDNKGWMVKMGKFGSTPEDELWHCASTRCRRASIGMIFHNKEEQELAKSFICGTI